MIKSKLGRVITLECAARAVAFRAAKLKGAPIKTVWASEFDGFERALRWRWESGSLTVRTPQSLKPAGFRVYNTLRGRDLVVSIADMRRLASVEGWPPADLSVDDLSPSIYKEWAGGKCHDAQLRQLMIDEKKLRGPDVNPSLSNPSR